MRATGAVYFTRIEICVSWPWNSHLVMLTQYIFICWQSKLYSQDTHLVVDISVRRKNETASLALLMPIWPPACLYHKHSSVYLYYYYDLGFSRFIWPLNIKRHLLVSSLNLMQSLSCMKGMRNSTLRHPWIMQSSWITLWKTYWRPSISIICKALTYKCRHRFY